MSFLNRTAAAALAAGLTFGTLAVAVVFTVGINDALSLQACRDEAAAAQISAAHCEAR
jgi:uncharacterized membrane protein